MSDVRVCVLLLSFCASAAPPPGAAPSEGEPKHNPLCSLKGCSALPAFVCEDGVPIWEWNLRSARRKGASDLVKSHAVYPQCDLRFMFAEPDPLLRPSKVPEDPNTSMSIPTFATVCFHCALCVGCRSAAKSSLNEEKNVDNIVSYSFLFHFSIFLQDQRDLWVRTGASCHAPWVNPLR